MNLRVVCTLWAITYRLLRGLAVVRYGAILLYPCHLWGWRARPAVSLQEGMFAKSSQSNVLMADVTYHAMRLGFRVSQA